MAAEKNSFARTRALNGCKYSNNSKKHKKPNK